MKSVWTSDISPEVDCKALPMKSASPKVKPAYVLGNGDVSAWTKRRTIGKMDKGPVKDKTCLMLALDTDIMVIDTIRLMNVAATAPVAESKRIGTAR